MKWVSGRVDSEAEAVTVGAEAGKKGSEVDGNEIGGSELGGGTAADLSTEMLRRLEKKEKEAEIMGGGEKRDRGDNEMDAGRLKDRSGQYKAKSSRIDAASESMEMSKKARQDHLDSIRKLQKVKEKMSPSRSSFHIGSPEQMHDESYDPSAEMGYIFHGKSSDAMPAKNESEQSEGVTMGGIAQLLQKELQPLKDSVAGIENKFAQLQLNVEGEIHAMKTSSKKMYEEQNTRAEILESNVDTLYEQVKSLQKESEKIHDHLVDYDTSILDIKEFLATGDADILMHGSSQSSHGGNPSIRKMQKEIADLQRVFQNRPSDG
eukprot:5887838-Karenia_brevis.AAC.1